MARYNYSCSLDIPTHSVLIDSNVFVAAFNPRDELHGDARAFLMLLAEAARVAVVPLAVIVEAWGLLARKRAMRNHALEFLLWLRNPGSVILLPQHCQNIDEIRAFADQFNIDFVDAMLAILSNDTDPPLRIATFDSRDFSRLSQHSSVRLSVSNLRYDDEWVD